MPYQLSDWERERLKQARQQAELKMAAERQRMNVRMATERRRADVRMAAERQRVDVRMAAERQRIERVREQAARKREQRAQARERFQPREVVVPDGKTVKLQVLQSGLVGLGFGDDDVVRGLLLFAAAAVILLGVVVHWAVFRGGWTVRVAAPSRKRIKIRLRTEEAAFQRMREVAEAVERDGLTALDLWTRRGRRRQQEREFGAAPVG